MKRYDVRCKHPLGSYYSGVPVEEVDGDWVRYEDVIDLEQQLAEAQAALWSVPLPLTPKARAWAVKHAAALKAAREEK